MAVAAAGAMAGMSMMPIIVVAIIGAVIGDFVSYWLGHRFRFRLRGMWPFATRPTLMGHAESFFHRYGTASVAICRFVPVLRSTVPLVAGMAGMARSRFLLANVSSAFVWAPAHVVPAQFAGLSLADLAGRRLAERRVVRCADWCCSRPRAGWLHRRVVARARVNLVQPPSTNFSSDNPATSHTAPAIAPMRPAAAFTTT